MTGPPYLDADSVLGALDWPAAIDAIAAALTEPAQPTPPRTVVPVAHGELMVMPAAGDSAVGVKVLTISPTNPDRSLPRIQALYVLFDAVTLTPCALLDGAALTTVRTPAVSAFAADALAHPTASSLTVFGAGPQAEAHVHALSAIRPISRVTVVGRNRTRVDALVTRLRDGGAAATVGDPTDVADADIVVCATTAHQPLFDGSLLAPHSCVIAVGSHQPDARELDDHVLQHADVVVVEDRPTALREAGDIILAIDRGVLDVSRLVELAQLGAQPPSAGRSVFKSVGVGWEDLAIAEAIYRRLAP